LRLRWVVVPVEIGAYLTTVPACNSSMLGAVYATSGPPQFFAYILIFADARRVVNDSAKVARRKTYMFHPKKVRFWLNAALRRSAVGTNDGTP
jgi:hypothetical protein